MIANIDKPKILDVFKKAKAQNLLHLRINSEDKDSLKKGLSDAEKFIAHKNCAIVIARISYPK